ncbi:histidine phosphatase family protein [Aeromicrobium sp. IC_218]|uniref:histidine phosphatase family protein n=1 Tax=Aeromicrobium sp. IC_218 TaxID=2545468 RepID=UPI001A954B5D|nr:histidine phosphatase family protein [Aeromicrobium sp. IC_218]
MSAEIWLVRHGETEWSSTGKHTSVTDLDLTDEGVEVAGALRPALGLVDFDHVHTSPRLRARRTAELAGFPDAQVDDDLVEWAYGDYEGITTPQIRERDPGWTVWDGVTPNGETPAEVAARLDRVVERAVTEGGRTLVFGHSHALRVLAARWLGLTPQRGRHFFLSTATISVLGEDRGERVVRHWNVSPDQARPGSLA